MTARPLNATAASLLGFLHDGPMTGWDLVAVAQQQLGDFWSLTQSQVYRELATMASDGLVEAGERGRRDRRPYTIKDAGRAAFVAEHRAVHARRLAAYEQIRAQVPTEAAELEPYALATLDFGLAYERAVLEWFDHLPAAITRR